MLSATIVPVDGGDKLRIQVHGGQQIDVTQSSDGLAVTTAGNTQDFAGAFVKIVARVGGGNDQVSVDSAVTVNTVLRGGSGRDTLVAGGGTTILYSGTARDLLVGGTGQDTLIALSAARDTVVGGTAIDSFWVSSKDVLKNVSTVDSEVGAVHYLQSGSAIPEAAVRPDPSEPTIGMKGLQYESFAGDPLFGPNGPSPDVVTQGQLGDCYFLATLAAVAKVDPNQIRQDLVQLDDGSYLVRFNSNGQSVYEHVDSELPTYPSGEPAFAQLGQDNSIWVAVMEKAFAMFRDNDDNYANLDGGWMSEVYGDLGLTCTDSYPDSAAAMMSLIQWELSQNEAVTIATLSVPQGIPIVSDHAYSVVGVTTDANGNVTGLTLRNPWGVAGEGLPDNNGYLTVTPAQAFGAAYVVTAAAA
jgi:hypothetical protein